jgi:hypothetical protein
MTPATQLALRAIVSGLEDAGAIDSNHIDAILKRLFQAFDASMAGSKDNYELGQLCEAIADDAGLVSPLMHDLSNGRYVPR